MRLPGVRRAILVALAATDLGPTLRSIVLAGLGVAMGNASEYVRSRADVVVRGHDEDGVAEAIERFVLQRAAAN